MESVSGILFYSWRIRHWKKRRQSNECRNWNTTKKKLQHLIARCARNFDAQRKTRHRAQTDRVIEALKLFQISCVVFGHVTTSRNKSLIRHRQLGFVRLCVGCSLWAVGAHNESRNTLSPSSQKQWFSFESVVSSDGLPLMSVCACILPILLPLTGALRKIIPKKRIVSQWNAPVSIGL